MDEIVGGVLNNLAHLSDLINSIQKLTETYNVLKEKVENLEKELAVKRTELLEKESWANLGKFSAFIAHQIRSPLSAILLYIDHLKEKVNENSELYYPIHNIGVAAVNISNFINDLLTLGKDFKLVKEDILLEDLINSLESKIKAFLAINDSISIKFRMSENFSIYVDRRYFEQAVFNLIKNAVEAVGSKGEVEISFSKSESYFYCEVTDTGKGIAPQIKETLFAPFFTTKKNGVGLGLAFAKKIINAHGGTIELKYSGEKGTCFEIVLPLKSFPETALLPEKK